MTREEKIQQFLDSKSRKKKLQDMKDSMCEWDMEAIIETAFSHIEENLKTLNDSDFNDEYYEWFQYDIFDDPDFDDDEDEEGIILLDKCECDLAQLMRGDGHNHDCPERK